MTSTTTTTDTAPPGVRSIADRLLLDLSPTDPVAARAARAAGLSVDVPLLSASDPAAVDDRLAAHQRVLSALRSAVPKDCAVPNDPAVPNDTADLDLAAAIADRAQAELSLHAVGFGAEQLAPLACVPQRLRSEIGQALDSAALASIAGSGPAAVDSGWSRAAESLRALPSALRGHRDTVQRAVAEGRVPTRRQVLAVAGQCGDWIDPAGSDWFRAQLTRAPQAQRSAVAQAIDSAVGGVREYRAFLLDLAPHARTRDAVGPETYTVTAGAYLGDDVDPHELSAWGQHELHRITAEIDTLARTIHPDGPAAAAAQLDADPARLLHTGPQVERWLEQTLQRSCEVLDGRFVTLPEHRLPRCRISDSGAGVMYYEPAEVDARAPGTVWWAREPGVPVHTWREHSTAHHEGVPGHHLQIALAAENPELHAWQRFCCHVHGHAEGWAHHAESWAGEIGLLEDPADRLGMLMAQAWRAARIVIDTGLHLGLRPPRGVVDGDPEHWTIPAAEQFLRRISGLGAVAARFEVERYLGWPGQALAFRVGARLFDEILAGARRRPGFEERTYRTSLLQRGAMGLRPLRDRVLTTVQ
ncbi:MAG: DUF885 domain-containing protein [Nakamurella sp.]